MFLWSIIIFLEIVVIIILNYTLQIKQNTLIISSLKSIILLFLSPLKNTIKKKNQTWPEGNEMANRASIFFAMPRSSRLFQQWNWIYGGKRNWRSSLPDLRKFGIFSSAQISLFQFFHVMPRSQHLQRSLRRHCFVSQRAVPNGTPMRRRCLSPLGSNNEAEWGSPYNWGGSGTTEVAGAFLPNLPIWRHPDTHGYLFSVISNHMERQFVGTSTRTGNQFGGLDLASTKAAMSLKVLLLYYSYRRQASSIYIADKQSSTKKILQTKKAN